MKFATWVTQQHQPWSLGGYTGRGTACGDGSQRNMVELDSVDQLLASGWRNEALSELAHVPHRRRSDDPCVDGGLLIGLGSVAEIGKEVGPV